MQKCFLLSVALLAAVLADECPDGGECEDKNTCCKAPAGGYGCCPMEKAECCEDHKHCCPEGTICVLSEAKCVNATLALPWVERVSAKPSDSPKSFRMIHPSGDDDDNVCPDDSRCPAEFSCLKAQRGYGCCPLAQGVACSDGKHCCPESHRCSEDGSSCLKQVQPASTVLCSDGKTECPDQTTCCESKACCPLPKAVCCEDMIHCCPEGSTCDTKRNKCISPANQQLPMWFKFPAHKTADWENQTEEVQSTTTLFASSSTGMTTKADTSPFSKTGSTDVPCDDTNVCPDGSTCCKTKEGNWACCPFTEAVCCDDHLHCCPHGKTCDLLTRACVNSLGSVPWMTKFPPKVLEAEEDAANVTCDASHSCPDGTTCCTTSTGDWQCCPFPQAVCCDDHVHCCPNGYTCDLAEKTCDSPLGAVPMVGKEAAHTTQNPPTTSEDSPKTSTAAAEIQTQGDDHNDDAEEEDGRMQCDATTACPRHTTCCLRSSVHKWGCCPIPEGVCCSDGDHCCPKHFNCDVNSTSCTKGDVVIPWYNQLPVLADERAPPPTVRPQTSAPPRQKIVWCDDSFRCEDGQTCCRISATLWGCCPILNAVCCSDMQHCCPPGHTCDGSSCSQTAGFNWDYLKSMFSKKKKALGL